ncbi:hypothetical protein GCM10010276_22430 [Streptomyces longisporus]|uniref:Uncharacterized protein n=1 Tax=Streptomyces longisporus TaxID=1948 RepID=A0ABN3LHF5_STRLO
MRPGSAPAALAFAADAGAFAALGGQGVGVAAVGVAPAQIGVQVAGGRGVVERVAVAQDEAAQRPKARLDGVGPGRLGQGEAQLALVAGGPCADALGLVPGPVAEDT